MGHRWRQKTVLHSEIATFDNPIKFTEKYRFKQITSFKFVKVKYLKLKSSELGRMKRR